MQNILVSLKDLVKLAENEYSSEEYVMNITGLESKCQYRHKEILNIKKLLTHFRGSNVKESELLGFIYSYTIPHLGKEMDLLKVSETACINIELKNQYPKNGGEEKIKEQLEDNKYYLNMLKKELFQFTYVSETDKLYKLEDSGIHECTFYELVKVLKGKDSIEIDLDTVFSPANILVSPLNNTREFLDKKYVLTMQQKQIENKIIKSVSNDSEANFISIEGGAGTGKTLLIYDSARKLSNNKKTIVIHCGKLCDGHKMLDKELENVYVIPIKNISSGSTIGNAVNESNPDVIIVDECQRIYEKQLNALERWAEEEKKSLIFSFDEKQVLSKQEESRCICDKIRRKCEGQTYTLTKSIRVNEEIMKFTGCLFDSSKLKMGEYDFPNVQIIYMPDDYEAFSFAVNKKEYTFIAYTAGSESDDLAYQNIERNVHHVCGQEFDNVSMIMNKYFYYSNGQLCAREHPNRNYLLINHLYQGLTRAKRKLLLIITDKEVYDQVSKIIGE